MEVGHHHPLYMSKPPQSTALNLFQYCLLLSQPISYICIHVFISSIPTPSILLNQPISAIEILCSSSFLIVQHSALYNTTNSTKLLFVSSAVILPFHIFSSLPNIADAFPILCQISSSVMDTPKYTKSFTCSSGSNCMWTSEETCLLLIAITMDLTSSDQFFWLAQLTACLHTN